MRKRIIATILLLAGIFQCNAQCVPVDCTCKKTIGATAMFFSATIGLSVGLPMIVSGIRYGDRDDIKKFGAVMAGIGAVSLSIAIPLQVNHKKKIKQTTR